MRFQTISSALAIASLTATGAICQTGGGVGSGGGIGSAGAMGGGGMSSGSSGGCSGDTCRMTFTFGNGNGGTLQIPTVTGAPYSGRQSSENVRTLADGTHLTSASPASPVTYRDSNGRIRTERPMFPGPSGTKPPIDATIAQIQDPVAGYIYVLDPVNHIAHRMPAQARAMPSRPVLPAGGVPQLPGGMTMTVDDLGSQVISGVTVTGKRTTTVTPPGGHMGNDRPLTSISETWTDPRTGVVVLSKSMSPTGDNTMTMKDYSNVDPDPALFQVPTGYQILDEPTNSFTMIFSRTN